jgi:hypothetical protein
MKQQSTYALTDKEQKKLTRDLKKFMKKELKLSIRLRRKYPI